MPKWMNMNMIMNMDMDKDMDIGVMGMEVGKVSEVGGG